VTDDERVRLFVALELPAQVRDVLVGWRSEALAAAPDLERAALLRAVPPDSMHVTLCFLGWRSTAEVPAIGAACETVSSLRAAGLTVGEALWLPPRRPRVLTVSLADDEGRLAEVQARLSHKLEAGGWFRPERRSFLAHVTVARVGKGGRVGREARARLPEPPRVQFEGATVTLFQSRLSPRGAHYVALATVALAG
jgi:2'-5' RNA ligase